MVGLLYKVEHLLWTPKVSSMKKVVCIDDSVDGITLDREYIVRDEIKKEDGEFYFLLDDYNVFNQFKIERFKEAF